MATAAGSTDGSGATAAAGGGDHSAEGLGTKSDQVYALVKECVEDPSRILFDI